MNYHGCVVPIKIYPLRHDESFHSSLLLFLFHWLLKRWEITKVVLIKLIVTTFVIMSCKWPKYMWIWLSVSQPLILLSTMLISPCSNWNHKLQAMVILCMHSWAVTQFGNTAALKSLPGALKLLPGAWDVTSFSLYTDSSHNYEIYNILCLNKLTYTFLKWLQLLPV